MQPLAPQLAVVSRDASDAFSALDTSAPTTPVQAFDVLMAGATAVAAPQSGKVEPGAASAETLADPATVSQAEADASVAALTAATSLATRGMTARAPAISTIKLVVSPAILVDASASSDAIPLDPANDLAPFTQPAQSEDAAAALIQLEAAQLQTVQPAAPVADQPVIAETLAEALAESDIPASETASKPSTLDALVLVTTAGPGLSIAPVTYQTSLSALPPQDEQPSVAAPVQAEAVAPIENSAKLADATHAVAIETLANEPGIDPANENAVVAPHAAAPIIETDDLAVASTMTVPGLAAAPVVTPTDEPQTPQLGEAMPSSSAIVSMTPVAPAPIVVTHDDKGERTSDLPEVSPKAGTDAPKATDNATPDAVAKPADTTAPEIIDPNAAAALRADIVVMTRPEVLEGNEIRPDGRRGATTRMQDFKSAVAAYRSAPLSPPAARSAPEFTLEVNVRSASPVRSDAPAQASAAPLPASEFGAQTGEITDGVLPPKQEASAVLSLSRAATKFADAAAVTEAGNERHATVQLQDFIKLGLREIEVTTGQPAVVETSAPVPYSPATTDPLSQAGRSAPAGSAAATAAASEPGADTERRAIAADMCTRALERQIVNAARSGSDIVRMQLYPPGLGQVLIRMTMDGSRMRLSSRTTNAEAAEALRQGENGLREALAGSGFDLAEFDVSDQDHDEGDARQRQPETKIKTPDAAKTDVFAVDMNA